MFESLFCSLHEVSHKIWKDKPISNRAIFCLIARSPLVPIAFVCEKLRQNLFRKCFLSYDVAYNIVIKWGIKTIIIIISLFQEDNIFGTNASLHVTYGPRLEM